MVRVEALKKRGCCLAFLGLFLPIHLSCGPSSNSPPDAPSNLTVSVVSPTKINVTWTDNSFSEDQFVIEGSFDQSGVPGSWFMTGVTGSNVSSFLDASLANSTTYWYRVRAKNTAGFSGYSNAESATTGTFDLTGITAVTAGYYYNLALQGDGTVWAWGHNQLGSLGDGTEEDRLDSPVRVQNLTDAVAVAAGAYHNLALQGDGTVWAWGTNYWGQLGDGTTTNSSVPVQVQNLAGVTAIAAGGGHSLAVAQEGRVWAWGYKVRLDGNVSTVNSSIPVEVQGISNITAVAAGLKHSLALEINGSVWAWGGGTPLGNGTTAASSVPVQVIGLVDAVAVACGDDHSLALLSDATVRTWGKNLFGQLGDGTTTGSTVPIRPASPDGVVALAGGDSFSLAVRDSGTVWVWGLSYTIWDATGGNDIQSLVPIPVPNLANVVQVAAGHRHSLALLGDGTVWDSGIHPIPYVTAHTGTPSD